MGSQIIITPDQTWYLPIQLPAVGSAVRLHPKTSHMPGWHPVAGANAFLHARLHRL